MTTPGSPFANRRLHARRILRTEATVVLTPTQSFPVRTVDISAGGMGIIAAANAPQGAKFTIKIPLPTRAGGKQVIEVRAQVQHSIFAADEQGYKVGLLFVDPDRATTSAILDFVN